MKETKSNLAPATEQSNLSSAIPLLDLVGQYQSLKPEIDAAIKRVVDTQTFILGSEVESLEMELAKYCGVKFSLGVSSGTDALVMALMAYGVGHGDEVITTPYSFFATAGSIARLGARAVFVDVDPKTYNMRADLIEDKLTERTKAILPVHLYGQCAEVDQIVEIGKSYKLPIIEDACQAIGAKFKNKSAGAFGEVGCFSFFPSKNLGCFGDGGLITTDNEELYKLLKSLRTHGETTRYHHDHIGGNFRLDALQAAVLRVKLKSLDNWTRAREANAAIYEEYFSEFFGEKSKDIIPHVAENCQHVFNQYVIRCSGFSRDKVIEKLKEQKIGYGIYYPVPLHLQNCFSYLGYKTGDFPESEKAALETLALPVYPELKREQLRRVVEVIYSATS